MRLALLYAITGGGVSALLGLSGILPADNPLTGTLVVGPLVIGLLAAAGALAAPSPGWGRFAGFRLAGVGSLLVLAAARDSLGLRYSEVLGSPVIIVGLACLLFWQAYESLRNLGRAGGRHRQIAFFLIVLAVYAGVAPWSTGQRPPDGDEPYYLLLAHSLAYDLDADLANNYERGDSLQFMPRTIEPQPGDPVGPQGEQFSRHNVLLPLILAPFYRAAGLPGALAVIGLIAAALATVILRTADLYFPEQPEAGLAAASVAALSPPLLLQSHQFWVEVPAALLVAIGFEAASRLQTEPGSRRDLAKLLGAALVLPLLKLRFLALAVPLLAVAVARAPRRLRTTLVGGSALLAALMVAILAFNRMSFGQALKHHSTHSLQTYLTSPGDYLSAPLGLFFDCSFGLFFAAPIWLLLVPGAWESQRRRRVLLVDTAIVCSLYLILLGPRPEWYGGWSPVFRYGMVFLPFLALFLVPVLCRYRLGGVRFLIAALGGATACLTLLSLAHPGWTYNFADGRGHLLDHLTVTLGADVARLFPSAVRPRAANLIWLLAVPLLPMTAFLARRRAGRAAAAWGMTALLLASAVAVVLAETLPTRAIEFEDPYVEKHGGTLWPDRWVPSRVAYRGSWRLGPGDEVGVALRTAGRDLVLTLEVRRLGDVQAQAQLAVLAGDRVVSKLALPPSPEWSTLPIGPLPWPTRAPLGLRLVATGGEVLLDRAELEWRD